MDWHKAYIASTKQSNQQGNLPFCLFERTYNILQMILLPIITPLISILHFFDITTIFPTLRPTLPFTRLDFMNTFNFSKSCFTLRTCIFPLGPFFNTTKTIQMGTTVNFGQFEGSGYIKADAAFGIFIWFFFFGCFSRFSVGFA